MIYVDPNDGRDHYQPPCGEQLGVFKDELEGDHIVEFASGGPKTYTYITAEGNVCLKMKGFTLNYMALQQINFDVIRDMISTGDHAPVYVNMGTTITRTKKSWRLFTAQNTKRYKFLYTKRILLDNLSTIPFGYRGILPLFNAEHDDSLHLW